MQRPWLLVVGIGALALTGCPGSGIIGPHQIGVGGGGGAGVLVFLTPPPDTALTNAFFVPPVQVEARDALGARDTTVTGAVTLTLGVRPIGSVLSGTVTVNFASGISTFTDLQVDLAGFYTLIASSAGFTAITSDTIVVLTP